MKTALGKGLDALISDEAIAAVTTDKTTSGIQEIPIQKIRPNPKQPRQRYDETSLTELTTSIKQRGVLQPILVTPTDDGRFEIIAGERRWRAAQRVGLSSMPAVVKTATELDRFQMALIENIQREDLNPMEQARGYTRLANEFHMTQEAIATAMGKDRAVIANTLRLLSLPSEIQDALTEGKISSSHGRMIASLDDAAAQLVLFQRIVSEQLSVRATEQAVRDQKAVPVRGHLRSAAGRPRPPEVKAIEEDLQRTLSRKVELQVSGPDAKKGWLRLEFYSLEDLDHLISQLRRSPRP